MWVCYVENQVSRTPCSCLCLLCLLPGKSVYFWALVSALGTFWLGAGVSMRHSIEELINPTVALDKVCCLTMCVLSPSAVSLVSRLLCKTSIMLSAHFVVGFYTPLTSVFVHSAPWCWSTLDDFCSADRVVLTALPWVRASNLIEESPQRLHSLDQAATTPTPPCRHTIVVALPGA